MFKPSNTRDWSPDQVVLQYADIHDNLVTIHHIRNFSYTNATTYTAHYYDKTYDLSKLKRVWYIVEPFYSWYGPAHAFVSFEFEENIFLAISIEVRKKRGEVFSPLKGLFNHFEIMYVIADEQDVIKLRSNIRKDQVYVYPLKVSQEKVQQLFIHLIKKANHLKDHPEFYNTLVNNCVTSLARYVNDISPRKVPRWSYEYILPAFSDRLLYNLGIIDTDLPFLQAQEKYHINARAEKYANSPDFSIRIRELE